MCSIEKVDSNLMIFVFQWFVLMFGTSHACVFCEGEIGVRLVKFQLNLFFPTCVTCCAYRAYIIHDFTGSSV